MNLDSSRAWLDWRLAVPFVGVGAAVGALVALRLSLAVPAADAAFPARGLVVFTARYLPTGGSVVSTQPGALRGLELPFLFATGAVMAGQLVAAALGTAVACWRVSADEWLPPLSVVGWLVAYALGVALLLFTGLVVVGSGTVPPVVVSIPLLAPGVVLFLTPAVIVIEGTSAWAGIARGASLFAAAPVRLTATALLVGYVGYLCTGVTALVGSGSVATYAVGAVAGTAVGGPIHAVALLWLYERLGEAGTATAGHTGPSPSE